MNFQNDHFGWEWKKNHIWFSLPKKKKQQLEWFLYGVCTINLSFNMNWTNSRQESKEKKMWLKKWKERILLLLLWNKTIEWHDVVCLHSKCFTKEVEASMKIRFRWIYIHVTAIERSNEKIENTNDDNISFDDVENIFLFVAMETVWAMILHGNLPLVCHRQWSFRHKESQFSSCYLFPRKRRVKHFHCSEFHFISQRYRA